MMVDAPRILLNGQPLVLEHAAPTSTLLDWLRGSARLTGTKEGCAEGDCGACTVVLESVLPDGTLARRAANSCMLMLGQLDGLGVRTIEGLANPDGTPHPLQDAFVASGGTQCGFCTPGFVMAGYAHLHSGGGGATAAIHDTLAGNLCRCTGYRPIVEAIATAARQPLPAEDGTLAASLAAQARGADAAFATAGVTFHAPRHLATALALRAAHPDALLLGGGTDLGLLSSRARTPPRQVIHLAHVAELGTISQTATQLILGASVTYAAAMPALIALHPALHSYLTRLGSAQIRNMGTIAGNLGTASPIGDSLPVLLALDAAIALASAARGARLVPMAEFITGYRASVMAADEIITAIHLPNPPAGSVLFADKLSKRRDQDISSVCAAFRVGMAAGRIADLRIAFGGVADRPLRAGATESALLGSGFEDAALERAIAALATEIAPLSDWRASAEYRRLAAGNLLRRLQTRLRHPEMAVEMDAL